MPVSRAVGGAFRAGLMLALAMTPTAASAYTVKQTESGAKVRWHEPVVGLRVDASLSGYFTDMQVREIVEDAAVAWRDIDGIPELLINRGEPGPRGFDSKRGESNGIYLVEDWNLDASSLAVTVATYESDSGRMVDTDILVNANHPFGIMPNGPDRRASVYDLRSVLTHEMGHVLGLGESYDERLATMWPYIARGETHQRDIDSDDEIGVSDAYAGAVLSETKHPHGCGGASVVVPRTGQLAWPAFVGGATLLALALNRLRRRRNGPSDGAGTFTLAFALLFALPYSTSGSGRDVENERVEVLRTLAARRLTPLERARALQHAAESESARVRMAAAAVLEAAGSREDRSLAAKLARDADPEVQQVARQALQRLHSAPPRARVSAHDPEAQERLAALLGDAEGVVAGEAVRAAANMRGGIIWSRYLVHGQDSVAEVEIPGGSMEGLTQVLSEQAAPTDGDTLLVALRAHGPHRWAHLRDGVAYGGWLGEGPGIVWTH